MAEPVADGHRTTNDAQVTPGDASGDPLVLVVDTSTPAVTAAVVRLAAAGPEVLGAEVTVDARAHGEKLAPAVRASLGVAGIGAAELTAIVAGTGPGPFTGLRVGLVTATAMGQTLGIPCYGVCSLDGIGAAAGPGTVVVATDARRREVYWALYADGVRTDGPQVSKPAELPGIASADRAAGDGALRYADQLGLPVQPEPRYPRAAALVALAADRIRAGAPGDQLTPLYLRRPDVTMPGARKTVLT